MARAEPRPPSEQPVIRTVRLALAISLFAMYRLLPRFDAVELKDEQTRIYMLRERRRRRKRILDNSSVRCNIYAVDLIFKYAETLLHVATAY